MTILHLTDPARSDVPVTRMVFPDGQPHVSIDPDVLMRTIDAKGPLEVVTALTSALDFVTTALALDAIDAAFVAKGRVPDVALNISFMLGARMDRRIAPGQPATLHVLASMLAPVTRTLRALRILDPHSPVTLEAISGATTLHPDALVAFALEDLARGGESRAVVIIPDQGAVLRTSSILDRLGGGHDVARCVKKRDPNTGGLSGFGLAEGDVTGRDCLIVDDICDGGGTFSGIAGVLREHGARAVALCVTHGVFSRGITIAGIDAVYCTDSYGGPNVEGFDVTDEDRDGVGVRVYRRAGEARAALSVVTDFVGRMLRVRS
jgi:ribose-phosphate pyrophosphokinase